MDIFIKKYQPDKYESWIMSSNTNGIIGTEKRKQRTNSLINALTTSPQLRETNEATLLQFKQSYLEKLRMNYSYANENVNLNDASERQIFQNKCRNQIITRIKSKSLVFLLNNEDLALHFKNYSQNENLNLENLCSLVLLNFFNPKTNSNNAKLESSLPQENFNYVVNLKSDLVLRIKKETPVESSSSLCLNIVNRSDDIVINPKTLDTNQKLTLQNKKCESTFIMQSSCLPKSFYEKTNGIWSFQSLSECELNEKILKFNQNQSLEYPHCSICLLFKTDTQQQNDEISLVKQQQNRLPINSEILVPEVCFTKKTRSRYILDLNANKSDNIDCLLSCKSCKLTVHQNCYSGNLDEAKICSDNWLCDKCEWKKVSNVNKEPQCCFCFLHGGALKQTDDKLKWAHVTCALCIESVSFKFPSTRTAINVPKNVFKEKKTINKCIYCNSFTQFRTSLAGLTAKCEIKTCPNRFHATCGYLHSGCYFDYAEWPRCVSILCHEHANNLKDELFEKKVNSKFTIFLEFFYLTLILN
jgi:hypothetical protein